MAQLVERLTLGFGSGYDLTSCEIKPALGSVLTAWSLLGFSLPLSLSALSLLTRAHACIFSLSLSLKINKH